MRTHRSSTSGISRRDFSRFLALSGSLLLPRELSAWPAPLAQTPRRPDERFWMSVRDQFLMPPNLAVMNAANLCPSPAPVLEAMYLSTKDMDGDPSFDNRQKMSTGKEETRRLLARFLSVTPEEIVITRNTSEANNIVSSGLDLKAGDEVVIFPTIIQATALRGRRRRSGSDTPFRSSSSQTLIREPTISWKKRSDRSRRERGCLRSPIRPVRSATCCRPKSCAGWRVNVAF